MQTMFNVLGVFSIVVIGVVIISFWDRKAEEKWNFEEMERTRRSKYWNEATQRIQLPWDVLAKMETRIVSLDELQDRMKQLEYNGLEHYPDKFPFVKGEVGHDLKWRYRIV